MPVPMSLNVNGRQQELRGAADVSLLVALRESLGLTGAKYACGEGVCGACTVLLDGEPVRACKISVAEATGHDVLTIEGLASGGRLHPVQQAFVEAGAMQCGYCTSGMILSAVGLLAKVPDPDEAQIRTSMDGNICRCCTYPRLLRAIKRSAELLRGDDGARAPATQVPPNVQTGASAGPAPWDLLKREDRSYFDVLGEGLVVVCPPGQAPAGTGRQPGPWLANGGAWIHVGASGSVTAFAGKIDVGQGNRTALTLLVAEELRLSPERVQIIMGDTDLCPFDVGTFGSRSMVDAGQYLRTAAAAARESLIAIAADRWGVPPAQVAASAGCVGCVGREPLSYGELLKAERRLELAGGDAPVTPPVAWRTAGKAAQKATAIDVVTGAQRYPSDLSRPGMLHGAVLRPPAAGAALHDANVAPARAIPGVTVVQDGPFIAVAAPDPAAARRAVHAIKADWSAAPRISEDGLVEYLRSHPTEGEGWETASRHESGDVGAALASAPIRVDATYTTAYIAHAPLETRVVLAEWDGGRLTVWTGTQQPFFVRQHLAEAFGIPEGQVRVIVPDTGGGFGGKQTGDAAVEAARIACAIGRPIKVRWSREEEFRDAYARPAAVIDVHSGAGVGGDLLAWDFRNLNAGAAAILCPYEIPNQRIEFQPAATPIRQGAYRALAATANTFARESHIDELALRLGLDPLELRLKHLRDERLIAVFRAAAEKAGWGAGRRQSGHGLGIAGAVEKGGRVATCAEVSIDAQRRLRVVRIVTAFECGAVVDPDNLMNQIEGATVMGLGGALFEALHFENGRISNASFLEYRVPRFTDVPPIDVLLLDRPDQPSAGGGETPMVALAPALANAIVAAGGIRIRSLPLAPAGVVPLADDPSSRRQVNRA